MRKALLLILLLLTPAVAQSPDQIADIIAKLDVKDGFRTKKAPEIVVTSAPAVGESIEVKLVVSKKTDPAAAKVLTDATLARIMDHLRDREGLQLPALVTVLAVQRSKIHASTGPPRYRISPTYIISYRIGRTYVTRISGGGVSEYYSTRAVTTDTVLAWSRFENLP